jgi:hypothetical protein
MKTSQAARGSAHSRTRGAKHQIDRGDVEIACSWQLNSYTFPEDDEQAVEAGCARRLPLKPADIATVSPDCHVDQIDGTG